MAYQQGYSLTLIQTQNPINASSVNFINLPTKFNVFYLTYSDLIFSGGDELWCRISTDNGSTWISSGYTSGVQLFNAGSSSIFNNFLSAAYMFGWAISSGFSVNGNCYFYNINSANAAMQNGEIVFSQAGSDVAFGINGGYCTSTNANGIQIFPKLTSFSGKVSLYGMAT